MNAASVAGPAPRRPDCASPLFARSSELVLPGSRCRRTRRTNVI